MAVSVCYCSCYCSREGVLIARVELLLALRCCYCSCYCSRARINARVIARVIIARVKLLLLLALLLASLLLARSFAAREALKNNNNFRKWASKNTFLAPFNLRQPAGAAKPPIIDTTKAPIGARTAVRGTTKYIFHRGPAGSGAAAPIDLTGRSRTPAPRPSASRDGSRDEANSCLYGRRPRPVKAAVAVYFLDRPFLGAVEAGAE